ncbi:hypothetical protein KKG29_01675 [Patescibacteria group bacterium]|nr:hypothetical protein [Patescibacteria group bacterium]MBU3999870.1 hypothetical protein [Patescibacteria group bacterium]MBU4056402.1 hypothetical protein [Patescibacteria group bacterium]MBU4368718.1 hypothetical protein [Patescibacteria group bacterium]
MTLTKNDLVKIKDVVLGAVEPMMVATQKEFVKIDERFGKIEKDIEVKFDKVITGQDKILKGVEDMKDEIKMDILARKRRDEKLENHEIRIVAVEKKLDIAKVN